MKKFWCVVGPVLMALLVLCVACSNNNSPAVTTIDWEPDGRGFLQFKTNDSSYYNYTFWYYIYSSHQSPMTVVETRVKKLSGYRYGGIGIIFAFQDHSNFYGFVIDVEGYYAVFKRQSGNWSTIIDWSFSSAGNQGYNVLNTLRVEYNDATDTFTLYIDGVAVDSFTDSSFSGGYSGYGLDVGASDEESFPRIPVDCRFNQLQPVTHP